jgi:hypothetical protein
MEGAPLAHLALLASFCRRRVVERAKLLLEYRVEYGKRGANPHRIHRALFHEIAWGLADANCGPQWAGGSPERFRLTVRKDD